MARSPAICSLHDLSAITQRVNCPDCLQLATVGNRRRAGRMQQHAGAVVLPAGYVGGSCIVALSPVHYLHADRHFSIERTESRFDLIHSRIVMQIEKSINLHHV